MAFKTQESLVPFKPGVVLDILSDTYPITPLSPGSEYSFLSLGSTPKTKV
jgi:hypothetical protein